MWLKLLSSSYDFDSLTTQFTYQPVALTDQRSEFNRYSHMLTVDVCTITTMGKESNFSKHADVSKQII